MGRKLKTGRNLEPPGVIKIGLLRDELGPPRDGKERDPQRAEPELLSFISLYF